MAFIQTPDRSTNISVAELYSLAKATYGYLSVWPPAGGHVGLVQFAGTQFAGKDETLDGRNAWVGHGVQRALGCYPRKFADFCGTVAAAGIWSQAA